MKNVIKQLIESKYNFNIESTDDTALSLQKSSFNQTTQLDAMIHNAMNNRDISQLADNVKEHLFANIENYTNMNWYEFGAIDFAYKHGLENQLKVVDYNLSTKLDNYKYIFDEFVYIPHGKVKVKDKYELLKIIQHSSLNADLNYLDVSEIVDMSELFENNDFNGNISEWDVSNVRDMSHMFTNSIFNGDISKWDTSKVKDMHYMFYNSKFNGDISKWDVSNVKDMNGMFSNSIFNKDISNWDVSNVKDMTYMFHNSKFNRDISKWNVLNVKNMFGMFYNSEFNQDISNWDVSNVEFKNTKYDNLSDYIFFESHIKEEFKPKYND